MTGRIVYKPTDGHLCAVSFHDPRSSWGGLLDLDDPARNATPDTVLECDCGRTFVAQPWLPGECFPRWQPESRWARWRRKRRQRRNVGGYPSSGRPASDLNPPPRGPSRLGPGVRDCISEET